MYQAENIMNIYFLTYLCVYIVIHIPFDVVMLLKKGKASYPTPSFKSTLESLSVVLPSVFFWLYLLFSPIVFFSSGKNIFVLEIIPTTAQLPLVIIGIIIMSIGLIVGCLGRIGRGIYLARDKAKLSTNWGHAIVRHPSYFLYITGFIGIPFAALSPYLFLLCLGIPGYIITTKYEELALIEAFGQEYKEYQKKVRRFLFKKREG